MSREHAGRTYDRIDLERLVASVTDAAYPVASRLGIQGSWLDLATDLRGSLAEAARSRGTPSVYDAGALPSGRTGGGPRIGRLFRRLTSVRRHEHCSRP